MITHTLKDAGPSPSNIRDDAVLKLLENFSEKGRNWSYCFLSYHTSLNSMVFLE
jgi:hypothetical protein